MFGIDSYTRILEAAQAGGYAFLAFTVEPPQSPGIYLRHDVDNSLECALEMARVNARLGVCGTFFVQLQSEIYNTFSQRAMEVLAEISK